MDAHATSDVIHTITENFVRNAIKNRILGIIAKKLVVSVNKKNALNMIYVINQQKKILLPGKSI